MHCKRSRICRQLPFICPKGVGCEQVSPADFPSQAVNASGGGPPIGGPICASEAPEDRVTTPIEIMIDERRMLILSDVLP